MKVQALSIPILSLLGTTTSFTIQHHDPTNKKWNSINPQHQQQQQQQQQQQHHIIMTAQQQQTNRIPSLQLMSSSSPTNSDSDCGCQTVFTGKPSDVARNGINHRQVIAKVPLYKIDGSSTTIDDVIGDVGGNDDDNDVNTNAKQISLVVFLRSLGKKEMKHEGLHNNNIDNNTN